MKTLPTLATAAIAVFLVLGPAAVFAATAVTVATGAPSYSGSQTVTVTGTVTPAPPAGTNVVITTRGPAGVVDINSVPVNSGAYSYALVTGGSTSWVTGTYTVNATWGGPAGTASATTTFAYTSGATTTTVSGAAAVTGINVQVSASSPTFPGQQEYIGVLTSWAGNGSLAAATLSIQYAGPSGAPVSLCSSAGQTGCTGTFASVGKGFYTVNFLVPATAAAGGYIVQATGSTSSSQGQGLSQFTVNPSIAQQSGFAGLTTGVSGVQSTLTNIQSSLGGLAAITTGISSLTTSVNNLQSTANTISSGLTTLTNGLSSLQSAASSISALSSKLDTVNANVSNSQTYVLVVAALAAITLVLELAILVRKLS